MTQIRRLFIVLFLFICLSVQPATYCKAGSIDKPAAFKPAYKILHIMSYHSPWQWTDGQLNGFKEALKGLDIEYKIFQMDTKRQSGTKCKQEKGREALKLMDQWQPDLVYTTDDDAQEYVTKHCVDKQTPFVFSGVNKPPEVYGFPGSCNIAGVLELVSLDIIKTFAEYKEKIKAYHQTADAAGRIARAILAEGKSASTFSMTPSLKGFPIISLARANILGIKLKSRVLLTAEVVQRFEWE